MPESTIQQLLDKIVNLLYAIQNFYEQVLEMNYLPEDVRDNFLKWYGIPVDFLRDQRDMFVSIMSCSYH